MQVKYRQRFSHADRCNKRCVGENGTSVSEIFYLCLPWILPGPVLILVSNHAVRQHSPLQ